MIDNGSVENSPFPSYSYKLRIKKADLSSLYPIIEMLKDIFPDGSTLNVLFRYSSLFSMIIESEISILNLIFLLG